MAHSINLAQVFAALALSIAITAQAQAVPGGATRGSSVSSSTAASQGPLANGEVLEIDKKANRVLLKHGPIQNIGMDAMTMEFLVPDGKLLSSIKPGDRVRFAAIWKDGEYMITRLEILKRHKSKQPRSLTPG